MRSISKRLSVLFVGHAGRRVRSIVSSLQGISNVKVAAQMCAPGEVGSVMAVMDPTVIVCDIDVAREACFDLATAVCESRPQCGLIFVSEEIEDDIVQRALEVGALAYLSKREPTRAMVTAIQEVAAGRAVFSREVMERIAAQHVSPEDSAERIKLLTRREVEIARYIAQGLSNKQIASAARISSKTVEAHSAHIRHKLGVHGRVDIARFAIRQGLAVA